MMQNTNETASESLGAKVTRRLEELSKIPLTPQEKQENEKEKEKEKQNPPQTWENQKDYLFSWLKFWEVINVYIGTNRKNQTKILVVTFPNNFMFSTRITDKINSFLLLTNEEIFLAKHLNASRLYLKQEKEPFFYENKKLSDAIIVGSLNRFYIFKLNEKMTSSYKYVLVLKQPRFRKEAELLISYIKKNVSLLTDNMVYLLSDLPPLLADNLDQFQDPLEKEITKEIPNFSNKHPKYTAVYNLLVQTTFVPEIKPIESTRPPVTKAPRQQNIRSFNHTPPSSKSLSSTSAPMQNQVAQSNMRPLTQDVLQMLLNPSDQTSESLKSYFFLSPGTFTYQPAAPLTNQKSSTDSEDDIPDDGEEPTLRYTKKG